MRYKCDQIHLHMISVALGVPIYVLLLSVFSPMTHGAPPWRAAVFFRPILIAHLILLR
jgi:hypothetical protein